MKIEDILKYLLNDNWDLVEEGHTYKILEKDECELLLNYITDLQRKEYNNSKAIEFINNLEKDYDENVWVENEYYVHILNILEKGE